MNAARTVAGIAATPVTVRVYEGYCSTDRTIETTVGKMFGEDHIAWIMEQPHPAITADGLAHGQWMCNALDRAAGYTALAKALRSHLGTVACDDRGIEEERADVCPAWYGWGGKWAPRAVRNPSIVCYSTYDCEGRRH